MSVSVPEYQKRVRAGGGLLLLVAVFSCLETLRTDRWAPKAIDVPVSEARVQSVRNDLPQHGTIGYLGDEVPPGEDSNPYYHEFFHIQYALAPVILVDSQDYPLVLGDFHEPVNYERISKLKLALVKDYGNGVMLFRRSSQ